MRKGKKNRKPSHLWDSKIHVEVRFGFVIVSHLDRRFKCDTIIIEVERVDLMCSLGVK